MIVLVISLVLAVPLYASAKNLSTLLLLIGFAGILAVVMRLVFDLLGRECTRYLLAPEGLVFERGLLTPQRTVIPWEKIQAQNTAVRQSWRGQLGGYGSLVLRVPEVGQVELKYLDDPKACRREIFKRLKPDTAETEAAIPVPVPASSNWIGGVVFAVAGLFVVLTAIGLYFTATSVQFETPEVGSVPVRLPLPFGGYIEMDAIDFLRSYWSILTTPPFSLIFAVLILLFIVRLIYTFGLRRR